MEVNLLKTHQFSTISIAASFLKPIESAAEPEEETIYFYGAAAHLKQQIIDAFGYAAGSRFMYSANLFFDQQLKTCGTRLIHPLYDKNLHVDALIKTFADMSFPSSLAADAVEKAKDELLLKIEKKFTDPFSYSAARLAEEAFGNPMYGTAMFGRKDRIQAIHPHRFLDAADFIVDLLSQHKQLNILGQIQACDIPKQTAQATSVTAGRILVNRQFFETETRSAAGPSVLTLGFDCGEMKNASDYIKIQLIDGLLGKYGHSALFKHFREKDLAVYHVITRYDVMNNLLLVSICTDQLHEKEIPPRVLEAVSHFQVNERELEQAKQFLRNEMLLQFDSPEGLLSYMGILRRFSCTKEDLLDGISVVTCRDVMQFIATIHYIGAHVVRG
ncbi:insulinase family protein [Bacillus tequilensis]|uniref:Insulinase family protein n=1 Tax=Bacillus tequilensis TaxID=227866 RepID=A0A6H0WS21_9BACI|nr:insulinase family protein [Bacillus tequilensis]QIW82297.1 insulinase family protein [Bacillus tequilensis]